MRMWNLLKHGLFQLDAEHIHHLTIKGIKALPHSAVRLLSDPCTHQASAISVSGVFFSGRIGLAAGFDKNAELLAKLPSLGFHFAEVGTVTPLPQPGNPKPRLFRLTQQEALFNRFGFNNDGMKIIAKRIEKAKAQLPPSFRVGVNIGKNKSTPPEAALDDYGILSQTFSPIADYLVINLSSPNTPGLRDLQNSEFISAVITRVKKERNLVMGTSKKPPIYLKLAPELSFEDLKEKIIPIAELSGLEGWVLTNTLAYNYQNQTGGLSGKPLTEISTAHLQFMRKHSQLPIISVGGIMTPNEAAHRIQLGADLVQIYTGWIYRGPRFPGEICRLTHHELLRYSQK